MLAIPWVQFQREQRLRAATAGEYHADRSFIMAEIDEAIANHDLSTLERIRKKYFDTIPDQQLKAKIDRGLATLNANQRKAELTVSKLLDITRHREEMGNREFAEAAKKPVPEQDRQRLSVLPR